MTIFNLPYRTLKREDDMEQSDTGCETPISPNTIDAEDDGVAEWLRDEDEEEEQVDRDEDLLTTPHLTPKEVIIGKQATLRVFYRNRFWCIKQKACREIAKAWIRTVNPKKQATNPYNGGKERKKLGLKPKSKEAYELRKPKWWPTREDWWPAEKDCRHIEPDHQLKWDRICLMLKILEECGEVDGPAPRIKGEITQIKVSIKQLEASTNQIKEQHLNERETMELLTDIYNMKYRELAFHRGEMGKYRARKASSAQS